MQHVIWDRYLVGQAFQDFDERISVRCKMCREVEVVYEPGGNEDVFFKIGHKMFCWQCYAENKDARSEDSWADPEDFDHTRINY